MRRSDNIIFKLENGVYANLCNMQTFDKGDEKEEKGEAAGEGAAILGVKKGDEMVVEWPEMSQLLIILQAFMI